MDISSPRALLVWDASLKDKPLFSPSFGVLVIQISSTLEMDITSLVEL